MLLLLAAGEQPHRLVHGDGQQAWHCAALKLDEVLAADAVLAARAVKVGRSRWLVLCLEPGLQPGELPAALRDPATGRWTASVAINVFTPPPAEKPTP